MLRAQLRELRRRLVLIVHGPPPPVQGGGASELYEQPITPEWIDEGSPQAHSFCAVSSANGRIASGEWACTAGRFRWIYYVDEVIRILEGEVFLEIDGAQRRFGPGDTIFFPMGQVVRWHVPRYVRKVYFISHPGRLGELLRAFHVPGV